ncbi:hypothetical protein HD806DRAFT_547557 [Xylariaceae sp. AK1471]|nr:hypothetical protein HD806DRAFT_547557 [Xylariaceae sp. AK1471]
MKASILLAALGISSAVAGDVETSNHRCHHHHHHHPPLKDGDECSSASLTLTYQSIIITQTAAIATATPDGDVEGNSRTKFWPWPGPCWRNHKNHKHHFSCTNSVEDKYWHTNIHLPKWVRTRTGIITGALSTSTKTTVATVTETGYIANGSTIHSSMATATATPEPTLLVHIWPEDIDDEFKDEFENGEEQEAEIRSPHFKPRRRATSYPSYSRLPHSPAVCFSDTITITTTAISIDFATTTITATITTTETEFRWRTGRAGGARAVTAAVPTGHRLEHCDRGIYRESDQNSDPDSELDSD